MSTTAAVSVAFSLCWTFVFGTLLQPSLCLYCVVCVYGLCSTIVSMAIAFDYNVQVCKRSLQCSSVQTLMLQGCQQETSVPLQGLYGRFFVHLCQITCAK